MKKQRFALVAIILIAVSLRLGAALYLGDGLEGEQQRRIQDQVSYNALARSLINGKGYTFEQNWYPGFTQANQPTAHWSFLYPLYLALVYKIVDYHPLAARILQAIITGGLSVWLVYRIGQRLFNRKVGLVASGLSAVYFYFIFHDASLMTEAFFTVGVLGIVNLTLGIVEKLEAGEKSTQVLAPGVVWWLWLGAVVGLTALLRQTILLWLPFLCAWIYWISHYQIHRRIRLWGLILALGVASLFILPWTVRNYFVYQAFLPLNSNAGYALYSANHPNHGTKFDQDYVAPLPDDLKSLYLNEAQWNTELTMRGLQFIRDDPQRYLLLSLDRIPIFFNAWFSSESSLISNLMRVFSYGLYLPFYIYGFILSFREWRRYSLIYLFALVFSTMHILTWASIRYRLPIDAVMMPFAAVAVIDLITRIRTWFGFREKHHSHLAKILFK